MMPVEDNPWINLLVCVAPILVLYGAAALIGTFQRTWYIKKWRSLDRRTQAKLVDRDLNVAIGGWIILILFFATVIYKPAMLPGASLLLIAAGLVLITGSMIFSSLSLYFRSRSDKSR